MSYEDEERVPTNRIWGSTLWDAQALSCARCCTDLKPSEAFGCADCKLVYDRACLAVRRRCSCGGQRFVQHQAPEPVPGMFQSLGAALLRLIRGQGGS